MQEKFSKLLDSPECLNGTFKTGENGVRAIKTTSDGKIGFVDYGGKTLCYIDGSCGQRAIYPLAEVSFPKKVGYVVMDLDGTSIVSEEFWIEIIRLTTSEVLGKEVFFSEEDIPFVSGNTTMEHLHYALAKYGDPAQAYANAMEVYHKVSRTELEKALVGDTDKIRPTAGLKEFLLELKKTRYQDRTRIQRLVL